MSDPGETSAWLRDPSGLPARTPDGATQAVIETPGGSRNKYTFDHERHLMRLGKVLPAGMTFPFDFGYVPSTLGGDGDPIDILVLSEQPTFPGCVLTARLIGVIKAEDVMAKNGAVRRNDRLLAVANASHEYAALHEAAQLPETMLRHLVAFFVNYADLLPKKTYRVLGTGDAAEAEQLLEQSIGNAADANRTA